MKHFFKAVFGDKNSKKNIKLKKVLKFYKTKGYLVVFIVVFYKYLATV